jgi:hypothetical protein
VDELINLVAAKLSFANRDSIYHSDRDKLEIQPADEGDAETRLP